MGYASKSGHAQTSASKPRAHAICQRCGRRWNWNVLRFQYQWCGAALQNIFLRVCPDCYDTPSEQLRSIILPPDPLPTVFATPEFFLQDETSYRDAAVAPTIDPVTGLPIPADNHFVTDTGAYMTLIPVGAPTG